jgi:hypothetical protein
MSAELVPQARPGYLPPGFVEQWPALRAQYNNTGIIAVGESGKVWGWGRIIETAHQETRRLMKEQGVKERTWTYYLDDETPRVRPAVHFGWGSQPRVCKKCGGWLFDSKTTCRHEFED